MATNTPNYNLSVPENTDTMEDTVQAYRDNLVIIDNNLGGGGGGGNADVVHLSQEEYDALPASKTSDHKIYMIEDSYSESQLKALNVNGVFIDTSNVIASGTFTSTFSYTATQDCFIFGAVALSNNTGGNVKINNELVGAWYNGGGNSAYNWQYFLKKGQTLTAIQTLTSSASSYIVYGIQPASNVVIIPDYLSSCYSTSERQIGCWTNGKPLYEKTIQVTATIPYNSWVNTGIVVDANAQQIVRVVQACGVTGTGCLNFIAYVSTGGVLNVMNMRDVDYGTNYQFYITVQYFKSTDTAGSGEWTPHGTPTVHYSTEETCIGTWIDGKPLYEKTISCGTLPNNTTKNVAHSISDIEYAVTIQGSAKNPNNGIQIPIPYVYGNIKCLQTYIDPTNIKLISTENLSGYTESYVKIQYTKTTD